VELLAVKQNEAAISLISNLTEEKKLKLLKGNPLTMKYFNNTLLIDKVEEIFKEVMGIEEVEEQYIRNFINSESIGIKQGNISMDKILFIYKYGSKKAKKIAVDEKLRY